MVVHDIFHEINFLDRCFEEFLSLSDIFNQLLTTSVNYGKMNPEVIIMENLRFYSVGKVAEILDVSIRTVRRLISDGELETIKVRKSIRISDTHLDEYVKRNNPKYPKKRRFSLEGIIENGQVDEDALDEVTKIWESRELQ